MSTRETVDLGLNDENRLNSPWEFPNCPECQGHLFVDRSNHQEDFVCHRCAYRFDQPAYNELREELRQ